MAENNLKTILLLGALTGLILAFGWLLGGRSGVIIALVFAALTNLGAWWFSDSIAMSMNHAQQVSREQAPELHQTIGELAQRAGLPMPTVWVVNSPVPNAFATGRSPEKGAVAVTTGLIQSLSREEVAGVISHELAHIKNRDTLISSVAATIAGALTSLAGMARWGMMFGGYGYNSRDRNGGNALGAIGAIFMMILAPIAAAIIQAAISRSREFVADEAGARIMGNPLPLASALQTLENANQQIMARGAVPQVNPATAHMYIINPLQSNAAAGGLGGLGSLFSTHPPTRERVARLQALAREMR